MTAWKSLEVIPHEVIAYIDNLKCPICKSRLANDRDDGCASMDTTQDYVVLTCCIKDGGHYNIGLAWNDPVSIYVTDEIITFHYSDKEFTITKWYTGLEIKTDIKIYGLDELDHVNEDDAKEISFTEDLFNFNNFNASKFGELIKTLLIFR